jgi:hypothetical protein
MRLPRDRRGEKEEQPEAMRYGVSCSARQRIALKILFRGLG